MIAPLSRSYADARAAFLDAAATAGARIESFPHPSTGLTGEELFVDVAEVGPADADGVVIVVSGTHGVEGYLGSALQRHHLESYDTEREHGPAIVFVHALNPYGFSWVRRVNEDNVDLNRNFVDWSQPPPVNDGYADLADSLVPSDWSPRTQERTLLELMGKMEELGLERLQQIVSGGQYDHPTGVFYGGTGPTWSNDWLRTFMSRRLDGVSRAAIIDLHTGLGPWGHGELISSERPGSDGFDRQRAWWGDVISMADDASVSADLSGDWLARVFEWGYAGHILYPVLTLKLFLISASIIVLIVEYYLAAAVLCRLWLPVTCTIGIALHLCFALMLNVDTYSLTMILGYLAVIPADRIHAAIDRLQGYRPAGAPA